MLQVEMSGLVMGLGWVVTGGDGSGMVYGM